MKDNTFTIACIAVILILILTVGCTTIETAKENAEAYQLLPSPAGMIRFNTNNGKTEFLIQTPAGMRWLKVPEADVELIPIPVPQRSSMPGAHWQGLD